MEDALAAILDPEADPIATWKESAGWPAFPDYAIPCPLGKDALNSAYSMDSVKAGVDTSVYDAQVAKLVQTMQDAPINKTAKASTSRQANMRGYSASTIETR